MWLNYTYVGKTTEMLLDHKISDGYDFYEPITRY